MNVNTVNWKALSHIVLVQIQQQDTALVLMEGPKAIGKESPYRWLVTEAAFHRQLGPREKVSSKMIRTALFELRNEIKGLPNTACVWAFEDFESGQPTIIVGVGYFTNDQPLDKTLEVLDLMPAPVEA